MNPDEHGRLLWRKDDDGYWYAERTRWDRNETIEILGRITDKEYFYLKLAGKLDLELNRLFCEAVMEYIGGYPE